MRFLSPNLKGKPRSPPPRLQSLRRGDSQRLRSTVQGIKTTCRWSLGATFLLSLFSLSLAPTKITNVSCSQNNYTYLNYGWPLRLQHHSQTLLWWGCFQSHDRQKERSVPFWSHIKLVLWNVYVPWSTAIWKILAKHAGFIACCRHSNGAAAILSCLNFDQLCPSPKNRFTAHSK